MSNKDNRIYIAIDLKSFYASVECVERGLDPLTTNLVVADESRTEKTICLAVTPSLKKHGIGGRARLFEVYQKAKGVDFIIAMPRMALYIDYSARIYSIYLKYIAPEDMHVYSIDEVFMDVTDYLDSYKMTAHQLAITIIRDVLKNTGITATAGIGTNMYLCKVAMDIVAKHMPADSDGVRIAELDEMAYRKQLWNHFPLTDFWRVGHGIADKLARYGIDTMGKVARCSIDNEELLYRLFGINAELLIDHAWGWEPCTINYIKNYRPEAKSMSSGQVLSEPYTFSKARNVVMEMADDISLSLVEKRMATNQLVLTVGYDRESLTRPNITSHYQGEIVTDHYGRPVPKPTRGTVNLNSHSSSSKEIINAVISLYDRIVNKELLIRRLNISTNHIKAEAYTTNPTSHKAIQLDLFTDTDSTNQPQKVKEKELEKERRMQEAMLKIKHRFGNNAILKGTSFSEGATGRERHKQIGGHKA